MPGENAPSLWGDIRLSCYSTKGERLLDGEDNGVVYGCEWVRNGKYGKHRNYGRNGKDSTTYIPFFPFLL